MSISTPRVRSQTRVLENYGLRTRLVEIIKSNSTQICQASVGCRFIGIAKLTIAVIIVTDHDEIKRFFRTVNLESSEEIYKTHSEVEITDAIKKMSAQIRVSTSQ